MRTWRRRKETQTEDISVNNGLTSTFFQFSYFIYKMGWIKPKSFHATVPLTGFTSSRVQVSGNIQLFSYYLYWLKICKLRETSCCALKVLTNEKRGGLAMVSFDRSGFHLFSLWFSNKLMQAQSCGRHKTAQRTLFLLFANNNCFPTSEEKLLALFEFRRFFGCWGSPPSITSLWCSV